MIKIGIYKVISPNGKIYVGQSKDLDRRLKEYTQVKKCIQQQVLLFRSINKYGWKNHIFEIIELCNNNQLNEKERHWQDFYNVLQPNGLNCKLVNTETLNSSLSEETKKKISLGKTGSKQTTEHSNNISKGNKGKHDYLFSDEIKEKRINSVINALSKKVINLETNIIYNSIKEASEKENISIHKLRNMLNKNGKYKNNSKLKRV